MSVGLGERGGPATDADEDASVVVGSGAPEAMGAFAAALHRASSAEAGDDSGWSPCPSVLGTLKVTFIPLLVVVSSIRSLLASSSSSPFSSSRLFPEITFGLPAKFTMDSSKSLVPLARRCFRAVIFAHIHTNPPQLVHRCLASFLMIL